MSAEFQLPGDVPSVNLTLRCLMTGKEVGPIIGKGGEIIHNIREESGAKIHISDGSCPERVITVTGTTHAIFKAYTLICKKIEDEDGVTASRTKDRKEGGGGGVPGLAMKLIVAASQCGSLIGKGGSKIKEIREITGANVQVASDTLPGCTERCVTVSGSQESITQCIYHICCVMLESPAKGSTVQYQPGRGGARHEAPGRAGQTGAAQALAGLLGLGGGGAGALAAMAQLAHSQIHDRREGRVEREDRPESSYQMSVPNELIGSVIGKGGSKIAEIRQMSGAMIRISKSDDPNTSPSTERQIMITGNTDSVALAKSLINMSLDLHKASLERAGRSSDDEDSGEERRGRGRAREERRERFYNEGSAEGLTGLASLLTKPDVLAAVNILGQLGGISGGNNSPAGGLSQVTGGYSGRGGGRSYAGGSGRGGSREDGERRETKRSKFAPY